MFMNYTRTIQVFEARAGTSAILGETAKMPLNMKKYVQLVRKWIKIIHGALISEVRRESHMLIKESEFSTVSSPLGACSAFPYVGEMARCMASRE